jgi:tetratricopeptide (TPR) repeat protein
MKYLCGFLLSLLWIVDHICAQEKSLDIFADPYQGYPLFFQAVEAGADGHLDQAASSFGQVLAMLPFHLEAKLNLGICKDISHGTLSRRTAVRIFRFQKDFYNMEERMHLEKDIRRIIERKFEYHTPHLLKGNMYYSWKQDSLALKSYDRALAMNPGSALGYFYRGRTQSRMERMEEAVADFSSCLRLEPGFSQALYHRGIIHSKRRNFKAAVRDFEKAMLISNNPHYHFKIYETYNNRGIQYLQQNRYEEARSDFDKAIRLDQRFGEVYLNRAMTHKALKNYDAALADFKSAESKGSGSADLHFFRAEIYIRQGLEDEAVSELQQAIMLNEEDARYHFTLAEM